MVRTIVDQIYGLGAGVQIDAELSRQFSERKRPEEIEEAVFSAPDGGPVWLPNLLTAVGLTPSSSVARGVIQQRGGGQWTAKSSLTPERNCWQKMEPS